MSVQVTVEAINVLWKRVYNFERFVSVSFGDLKTVVQAGDPTLAKENLIFVYMGCIVSSNETLLYDPLVDRELQRVEVSLFVVDFKIRLPKHICWKIDIPSAIAAKKYMSTSDVDVSRPSWNVHDLKTLIDSTSDDFLMSLQATRLDHTSTTSATLVGADDTNAPPVVPQPAAEVPPVPAAPAVPAPVLPVVEWLQWGVMARLLLVAFLFTYNRNLNTEKLAHMAVMSLFSYLFQIGAFGFLLAWFCHKMGLNFNPPVEPLVPIPNPNPVANNIPVPDPAADGAAIAAGNGEANGAAAVIPGLAVLQPQQPQPPQEPVAVAPAALPARPQVPLNAVQYLNQLCRDGFTIPTAPGIFLDIVSLFMGLFFSIVPSWAPFRLHR